MSGEDVSMLPQENFPALGYKSQHKDKDQVEVEELRVDILVDRNKRTSNLFHARLESGENCFVSELGKRDAPKFYGDLARCQHKNLLTVRGMWSCIDNENNCYVGFSNMINGDLRDIKDKLFTVSSTSTALSLSATGQRVFRDLIEVALYCNNMCSGKWPQSKLQFNAENVYYAEDNSGGITVFVGICLPGSKIMDYSVRVGYLVVELAGQRHLEGELESLVNNLNSSQLRDPRFLWEPALWSVKKRLALIRVLNVILKDFANHAEDIKKFKDATPVGFLSYMTTDDNNNLRDSTCILRNLFEHQTKEGNKQPNYKCLIGTNPEDLDRGLQTHGYMVLICGVAQSIRFKEEEFDINEW